MAEPYIFATAERISERKRLQVLESVFDPKTKGRLTRVGVAPGWRCLEVGAGAGSVARWLAERVEPTGTVVALDRDTRFLQDTASAGVEVLHGDVCELSLPELSFDLVHARYVFIHVPEWKRALKSLVCALKPGGWLVLEEPDFSQARVVTGPGELRTSFDRVQAALAVTFEARGLNHAFGATLTTLLTTLDLRQIAAGSDTRVAAGGSPLAHMMALSTEQLGDKYLRTGLVTAHDLDAYQRFASDPECEACYYDSVGAWGRKASGAS